MKIREHTELEVYKKAFNAAMLIFEMTKKFPKEETYSLTDQIRRSSRSVCANLAEAWRKRRYKAAFIAKLSDAESELPKPRCGLNSQLNAHTCSMIALIICIRPTTRSCGCSSQ
jgi:hypothetical protein